MPFTAINPDVAQPAPGSTIGAPRQGYGDNLVSMRTEMTPQLLNRTDITAARMNKWINWGYRQMTNILDLQQLWGSLSISATAGQFLFLLPNCISWIKKVSLIDTEDFVNTGGRELEMIDLSTFRGLPDTISAFSKDSSNRWGYKWFRFANMLVLWPTPNITLSLTIDFRVRPLDLLTDNDCPILPPEFHESIFYAGLERAWRALGDRAREAQATNAKLLSVRDLRDPDAEERTAMHAVLTPVTTKAGLYIRGAES